MDEFNARDYLSSSFIKKDELRLGGPRRVVIQTIEEADGLPKRNGQLSRKELVLVFTDGSRFGLRAQANLQRLLDAYGERTSAWIGKTIELYFNPDIPNPSGGPSGGVRVRVPEPVSRTPAFMSELEKDVAF